MPDPRTVAAVNVPLLEQLAQVVAADHLADPGPGSAAQSSLHSTTRWRRPRRRPRGGRSPAATRRPRPTSPGTPTSSQAVVAREGGRRISVDGVALRTDAVQHGEDERRFVGVDGGDDLDPGIDELGRGGPVVGVLGEEKCLAEEARRPQLGRRVRCRLAASLEPDATAQSACPGTTRRD